jgi:hypothetical protein
VIIKKGAGVVRRPFLEIISGRVTVPDLPTAHQMKIISATKAKAAPTNTALKEFVSPMMASSFGVDGGY